MQTLLADICKIDISIISIFLILFLFLTLFLLLSLLLLLLCRFIAFALAVINAEIFFLGELQLAAKGQEDAFTVHV